MQVEVEAIEAENPEDIVNQQIEMLRRQNAKTTLVQGRGFEEGDLCVVSFEAQDPESGETLPGTQQERMQIDSTNPLQIPLPGSTPAASLMASSCCRVPG